MNGTPLQLTLRELRAVYANPISLSIMACVGAIAGITGPFGTFSALSLGARLAYWLAIVFLTFGAGMVGGTLSEALFARLTSPLLWRLAVGGIGASVPVTGTVVLISALAFPDLSVTGISLGMLYGYCLAISLALMAILEIANPPNTPGVLPFDGSGPSQEIPNTDPKLLDRLPKNARAPLSHLSMADHYVEVHTERGMSLVLMRFSDAMAETDGVAGLQIHRSHWVSKAAVSGLERVDGRFVVRTRSGATLPVSRSFLSSVRAALIPK